MHFENECYPKEYVVKKLRQASDASSGLALVDRLFAGAIADVLGSYEPDKSIYFMDYVPVIINDTIESDSILPAIDRKLHLFIDGVASLTELAICESDEIIRGENIVRLHRIFKSVFSEKYADFLVYYWDSQRNALMQATDKFNKLVWQKGLFAIANSRESVGRFGETELCTRRNFDRIAVIFSRDKATGRKTKSFYLKGEENVPYKLFRGISADAPLYLALSMLEDVIARWPEDPEQQKRLMKNIKK